MTYKWSFFPRRTVGLPQGKSNTHALGVTQGCPRKASKSSAMDNNSFPAFHGAERDIKSQWVMGYIYSPFPQSTQVITRWILKYWNPGNWCIYSILYVHIILYSVGAQPSASCGWMGCRLHVGHVTFLRISMGHMMGLLNSSSGSKPRI